MSGLISLEVGRVDERLPNRGNQPGRTILDDIIVRAAFQGLDRTLLEPFRLASRQVGIWPLVLFALAGLGAIAVAILVSPALRHLIEYIALRLRDLLGIG